MNPSRFGPLLIAASLVSVSPAAAVDKSPVTPADLVRFAQIGDPETLNDEDEDLKVSTPSPDGSQVAVLVRRGNVEKGTNDGTLLVYRVAELMRGEAPVVVAEFSSATNHQPIAFVRWLADGKTLIFAGTRGDAPTQIYRADVATRTVEPLTKEAGQIADFDIDPAANRLLISVTPPPDPPAENAACKREGCLVTRGWLWDVEGGRWVGSNPLTIHDLRTGGVKTLKNPEVDRPSLAMCFDPYASGGGISPDGRYIVRLCEYTKQPLPWWTSYTASPRLRDCNKTANRGCWRQFFLVDLDSGAVSPISEAPAVYLQADPVWIDNGRLLALPGAIEPLMGVGAAERARRAASLAILLFDPRTGKMSRIARMDPRTAEVTRSQWDTATQSLIVETQDEAKKALPAKRYRRDGQRWIESAVPASEKPIAERSGVRLAVEQSLNDRPVLVAVDDATGEKRTVLDPNPWLGERALGKVELLRWKNIDGQIWEGGLYYPPDYKPGVRYPLVIQTHGFDGKRFSMDGLSRNYAGRALAAQRMVVLQANERYRATSSTPDEYPTVLAGWEAAIDHLDGLKLIDRNKVGIQGWSRTGPQMGYALTQSSYPFAAGAFTSTADFGWTWYLNAGTPMGVDVLYGAAPFGAGMKPWLENAPTFNLDRVRTPMFMWADGTGSVLWDWHAGLRKLEKPVEYWISPENAHDNMQTPQRLKLNQLLVDWFRFWLKGEQRTQTVAWGGETAEGLKSQNERWLAMRKQQDAVLAKPRPPLLKWAATPIQGKDASAGAP